MSLAELGHGDIEGNTFTPFHRRQTQLDAGQHLRPFHGREQLGIGGGISHDSALLDATPERAVEELRRALEATGGRRWLAAPGCSIPPATPPGTLAALRSAVESVPLPAEPRS